ncbi:MAG: pyridoxal phosphate-dependent aminotransferase [Fidelibacterota bacterium]
MTRPDPSFPLDSSFVDQAVREAEVDLETISIRELSRLVDVLSDHFDVEFLRFEFGIPGLPAERLGPEEEIRVLTENEKLPSTYPPFDGIPRLKRASSLFLEKFLNIEVGPEQCIPTVGAVHGCLIAQAVAGRRREGANTILYLDPGFPVNKLQSRFLGLNAESVDVYDFRGSDLVGKLEEYFSTGEIGGLLWSNPNNPTWVCLKEEELEGIGHLLTEYDVIGIEDLAYFGMDFRVDYGTPGRPPYPPTVARYTDNYIIVLSSSKIFSYAGQRVAVSVLSPVLMKKRYPHLERYTGTEILGHAFIHGGVYSTTAGTAQASQHGLAALFEAACDGRYDFLKKVRRYGDRARRAKEIFLSRRFALVYSDDLGEPIAHGFYFTVGRDGMTGGKLLYHMLRFGMAGIPLKTAGTHRDGIRICVSLLDESQFDELESRVSALDAHLR